MIRESRSYHHGISDSIGGREMMEKRALGLLSGGLDSVLAIRLVLDQDIPVTGFNVVTPFVSERRDYAGDIARRFGIPLIRLDAGDDYLDLVRHPRYGYGKRMNPCLDCRIYMLTRAKEAAAQAGASYIVTGDVLGQRPMTQFGRPLEIQEDGAGLQGLILRPLSAQLLPATVPERKGWVDRGRLLGIRGRSRKPQLALAEDLGVTGYRFPDGGCRLTNKEYSGRLRELLENRGGFERRDVQLLKIGRHFYHRRSRVIVGRNRRDNELLLRLKNPDEFVLEVPGCGSPITLIEATGDRSTVEFAAGLTAHYSDAECTPISVECRWDSRKNIILVNEQAMPPLRGRPLPISSD